MKLDPDAALERNPARVLAVGDLFTIDMGDAE